MVVVGAGAAGLMAAIFAAQGPRPVVLLERTRDGGRKILISGGGRCNVLPSRLEPGQFVTASSRNTLKKLLLSWPLAEQREFFEQELGIALALEAETGKLFPVSNKARDVRDTLVDYAHVRGVTIRFDTIVTSLTPSDRAASKWRIGIGNSEPIDAAAVIMASGGLSVPATGSDGTGLRLLERLGHTVHATYPALTPLVADPARHANLAGISLDVTIEAPVARGRFVTNGGFLFTHRGYSGPSVLDISHLAVQARHVSRDQPLFVQWTQLDQEAWDARLRAAGPGAVGPLLRRELPDRLAETLLIEADVDPQQKLATLARDARTRLVEKLTRYALPWTSDEGYKKAEVTGGGVSLAEIDPITLESRRHAGLFLCGELLDAFGPIGGYNFAWAWATGRAAGLGAGKMT